ncbi:MAG: pyruvate kinase [Deltaproteobacteria bacterium]|nr:pyruvate kinase [Deltaproteobacteria bacterium]
MRKAKIVCTIGPACSSETQLDKLILAGMDVARLNFSHGDHASHTRVHARLRRLSRAAKRPLTILQDVQGPRIRLGEFKGGKARIQTGETFVLTTKQVEGDDVRVSVQYPHLHKDVKKGDRVLIADGTIQLRIMDVEGRDIITKVVVGGNLTNHKGINLPGVNISSPSVTDKDKKDLQLGLKLGMDMVAISFVRNPEDVLRVRRMVRKANSPCFVIAKIEHPDAVKSLDDILDVCDGVMVARGDLGVELPPERVPAIQKSAIAQANARGKIVIVATQMLESMIGSPRPTRAEASDVANAVFDGSDALMLSGETAAGAYPLESLQMMVRIINEAERSPAFQHSSRPRLIKDESIFTNAVSKATVVAAEDIEARLIVAFTESGNTARLISDYRPKARIVALTPHEDTYNRMAIFWGVEPVKVTKVRSTDAMLRQANRTLIERGFVRSGEQLVITSGVPIGQPGSTNMLKLHKIS